MIIESSKQSIRVLNTTLKGIQIATKEPASIEDTEIIAKGILLAITKESLADEFISYVKDTYKIDLINI